MWIESNHAVRLCLYGCVTCLQSCNAFHVFLWMKSNHAFHGIASFHERAITHSIRLEYDIATPALMPSRHFISICKLLPCPTCSTSPTRPAGKKTEAVQIGHVSASVFISTPASEFHAPSSFRSPVSYYSVPAQSCVTNGNGALGLGTCVK